MYTIKPTTKYTDTPFDRPMFIHIVTETYDWEKQVPTAEDLKDKDKVLLIMTGSGLISWFQ